MHDAGSQLAANPAQVRHLVEQRVDERSLRVTRGRVDDHSGRLVDDADVRVLIDDVEVERFRLRRWACRLRNVDNDRFAGVHDAVRPHVACRQW